MDDGVVRNDAAVTAAVHGIMIVSIDRLGPDLLTRGGTPVMQDLLTHGS